MGGWLYVSLGITRTYIIHLLLVPIFRGSIPCVFFCIYTCTLLKVVSHYDLSVLSMSVKGFQKSVDRECVGGVSSIHFGGGGGFLEF